VSGPLVLVAVAFFIGLFIGQGRFTLRKQVLQGEDPGLAQVLSQTRQAARREVPFSLYWDVWDQLKKKYVGGETNDLDLFYGSLEGLVGALGDPYSAFLSPKTAEAFMSDLAGSFEGIGAEIGIKDGVLTVVAPLPDSPAERAGIMAGDVLVEIDGKDTAVMTLDAAVNAIRGARGTTVVLTIRRNGAETEQKITITRDVIDIKSVEWNMREGRIGYIKVNQFNEETWPEFESALTALLGRDMRGLIVDLRNNPGGFLQTAVQMTGEWLPDGATIVIERSRDKEEQVYRSNGRHRLRGVKTVVLINKGSASASEIMAGALQDHGAATIVGQQSFGKGSVQDFQILEDGSALKLTISEWLTPKNRQINKEGITPDMVIPEFKKDELVTDDDERFVVKALELLRAKE